MGQLRESRCVELNLVGSMGDACLLKCLPFGGKKDLQVRHPLPRSGPHLRSFRLGQLRLPGSSCPPTAQRHSGRIPLLSPRHSSSLPPHPILLFGRTFSQLAIRQRQDRGPVDDSGARCGGAHAQDSSSCPSSCHCTGFPSSFVVCPRRRCDGGFWLLVS